MTTVKKYRVFCDDEAKHVVGWSETEPTTCFNNNTHTIDVGQTAVVDVMLDEVTIRQTAKEGVVSDSYRIYTIYDTIAPLETKFISTEFKIDVNLFSVFICTTQDNVGDSYDVTVNKDTPVGTVTVGSQGTVIEVSPTAIAASKIGYYMSFDMITYHMILAVGATTITLENSVNVSIGDIAYIAHFMLKNKTILRAGIESMGSSVIGSARILKEYTSGITYRNSNNSTKRIEINIEVTF